MNKKHKDDQLTDRAEYKYHYIGQGGAVDILDVEDYIYEANYDLITARSTKKCQPTQPKSIK